ncbi:hypothetical protein VIGAN_11180300 [Vigna angularis var. angularis]|uniref:C2H2-type domain-containing protein n=1 Tax=Vigna angularis var. angularis TaxID=157739 RepID=A0A0S3TBM5_PHAAN|nr:uncharacterized protein LOC108344844 isoform X1 [Vigna angularis]BAU02304.1 hypothetical protein VIGAN_11180300 [Vigna angularis var. angularis]
MNTEEKDTIGGESSLHFPTPDGNSDHLLHLLYALDSQGWPLLSPLNVQLHKCDKCSREFCSPMNYRRHIRVDHRKKNLDKEFTKNRDLLEAYWDKLSAEEAKEVISLENVVLEEVPGSSILKSLKTLVLNQRFYSFPAHYLMAGTVLLDILQAKSSSFPISSQVLFNILDEASEKTFLCGTAESVQRYVFVGDAGNNGLELRNIIAFTSFLLEQKLVKAWLTAKEAEALRCQKQLVEEEEAAQKRQAEILERKRQKKLRQKEQKAREQRHKAEAEINGYIESAVKALSLSEASLETHNFEAHNPNAFSDNVASPVPPQYIDTNKEINEDTRSEYDTIADQNLERWSEAEDLHTDQISPLPNFEVNQKHEAHNPNAFSDNVASPVPPQCIDTNKEMNEDIRSEYDTIADQNLERWSEADDLHTDQISPLPNLEVNQKHEAHNPNAFSDNVASPVPPQCIDTNKEMNEDIRSEYDTIADQNLERWSEADDLHTDQISPLPNLEVNQKHEANNDNKASAIGRGSEVWSPKSEEEIDKVVLKTTQEKKPDQLKNQLLIGSISINIDNCKQSEGNMVTSQKDSMVENVGKENSSWDKPMNTDPVSQHETEDQVPVQSDETEVSMGSTERTADIRRFQSFIQEAKAFLARRWEEALASDHVVLHISSDSESSSSEETQDSIADTKLPATSGANPD